MDYLRFGTYFEAFVVPPTREVCNLNDGDCFKSLQLDSVTLMDFRFSH